MGRGSYLDCGCYIDTEGHRTWCPTCSAESLPPSRAEQELAALRARVADLEAALAAARQIIEGLRPWPVRAAELANERDKLQAKVEELEAEIRERS